MHLSSCTKGCCNYYGDCPQWYSNELSSSMLLKSWYLMQIITQIKIISASKTTLEHRFILSQSTVDTFLEQERVHLMMDLIPSVFQFEQLQYFHMSVQEKQSYLREVILEKGINPHDFFQFWQSLGIELEDIQFQTLKSIAAQFLQDHQPHHPESNHKEEEEQFSDFQQPQDVPQHKVAPTEYSDFNWDFLSSKSHSTHNQTRATQLQKTQTIVPPAIQKKKQQSSKQKQAPMQTSKDLKKTVPNKPKKQPQEIEQLNESLPAPQRLLDLDISVQEQKTLTVKQVLQSSKLNTIKCLKLQENVLSHHNNVEIIITNVEEMEDKSGNLINKIMKSYYLLFTIKTIARNKNRSIGISWEVKRKAQDFQWLRTMLVKFYPGLVIPPLPPYPKSKQKIFGYQKKLQNFLIDCYSCPELRNSKNYEAFLSYANVADFEAFMKNSENSSKPRSLNHILNMSGVVQTLYSKNIQQYGVGLQGYLNKSSQHLKQVKSILNEINDAYEQISLSYKKLGNVFLEMSDESHSFSNQKCYERLANTYKQIAFLSNQHSHFCEAQKQFIDAFMQSHFAYEKDRLDNMQSLIAKRAGFATQLSKRSKQEENKSSMFGKIASFFGQRIEYVDTPSSNYETLNNQVGYYNHQLLRESVRCIDVMIQSHINHFSGYGHTRIDNVDKMQKIWSNILVQLSKLNAIKRE